MSAEQRPVQSPTFFFSSLLSPILEKKNDNYRYTELEKKKCGSFRGGVSTLAHTRLDRISFLLPPSLSFAPMPTSGHTTDSIGATMNSPGKWKCFISHVQRESAAEAIMLATELGRASCWLDRFVEDKSVAAMCEGVKNSDVFCCILSDGYFRSEYCLKEARWAVEAGKPVLSLHKSGTPIGALLRDFAPPDLRSALSQIDSISIIAGDTAYFRVGMQKIERRLRTLGVDPPPTPKAAAIDVCFSGAPDAPPSRRAVTPVPPLRQCSRTVTLKQRIEHLAVVMGHSVEGRKSHEIVDALILSAIGPTALDKPLVTKVALAEQEILEKAG